MKTSRIMTAIFLCASGCNSTAPKAGAGSSGPSGSNKAGSASAPSTSGLAGKWQITSVSDNKGVLQAVGGDKPTLNFEKGTVSGNAGCNQFSGPVTQTKTTVTWGAISITELACADQAAMDREGAYMRALQASATFKIIDGKLEFRNQAGAATLTAVQAP